MGLFVQYEQQGRLARATGKSVKDNPYPDNSIEGKYWMQGYTQQKEMDTLMQLIPMRKTDVKKES